MKMIVDGIAAEYEDEGSGRAIVMLHGWKDSLRTFDSVALVLAKRFRVVRPDLPGFGGSEMPGSAWTLDRYVAFVAALTRKLDVEPAAIVAHSFGGRIAIKGVARGALVPRKLVLIAAAGLARRNTARARVLRALAKAGDLATLPLPTRMRAALRSRFYRRIKSDYADAGLLRETFKNVIAENLVGDAARIALPTLIIWGSADSETPLEEGVRLSELVEGSRLELFQAAGHFVHREHAESVAKLIGDFV